MFQMRLGLYWHSSSKTFTGTAVLAVTPVLLVCHHSLSMLLKHTINQTITGKGESILLPVSLSAINRTSRVSEDKSWVHKNHPLNTSFQKYRCIFLSKHFGTLGHAAYRVIFIFSKVLVHPAERQFLEHKEPWNLTLPRIKQVWNINKKLIRINFLISERQRHSRPTKENGKIWQGGETTTVAHKTRSLAVRGHAMDRERL